MRCSIQVVIRPVADVDRALAFYTEKAGFTLDVDYAPSDEFRVVQLTPPSSSCSIQIGVGLTDAAPGSMRGIYAVVEDLQCVRRELLERGVEVGEIRHKSPLDDWRGGWAPGPDADRADYASFADFSDPDGNRWVLQERGYRAT
jgi:catechol 2,3-dioxygenase-like lactoylglutathione lyase family enzyme